MTAHIISTYLKEDDRILGTPVEIPQGFSFQELRIQALEDGWVERENTFKSGAAPIWALEAGVELLDTGLDLVLISGRDHLRHWPAAELQSKMKVFDDTTLVDAYTELTRRFLELRGIEISELAGLSRALESNYRKSAERRGIAVEPRHEMASELFRMVDCANPRIDFEAQILLAREEVARELEIKGVAVKAVECIEVPDGPENVDALASYDHLAEIFSRLSLGSYQDLVLEAYTCFPCVPLALIELLSASSSPDEWLRFIQTHELTQSGGMNFARAPWNNPALRGLVLVANALQNSSEERFGLVHGNGGLGGRQGLAILCWP